MTTIRAFFLQIKALFPIFEKGQGRPPPLTPSSNTPVLQFHYFISLETANTQKVLSVSFNNFFRKCECISNCYLLILSNLLKKLLRKTSLFVLFELLPAGLLNYV